MSYDYDETMVTGDKGQAYSTSEDNKPTEVMRPKTQQPYQAQQPTAGPQIPSPMPNTATEILYQQPAVLAWLAVKQGPRAGKLYRLSDEVTSIGRDSHNEIIIDDNAVSRHHAKVRVEKDADGNEQFFLYDLASANGIRVNGEQVVKQMLMNNDEVEIGRTVLVFKRLGEAKDEDEPKPESKTDEERIEFGGEET